MKLKDIAEELELVELTPELSLSGDTEVLRGHASDLLSDVLGYAPAGAMLVTIQIHLNVIAVAVHASLAGVIFASGRTVDESVRAKAIQEQIPLFSSPKSTFDIVGRLYELGLRGRDE